MAKLNRGIVVRVVAVAVTVAACVGHVLELGSTQQASVVLPPTHDFGSVADSTSSAISTFTISPASGPQMDTVTSILPEASCSEFKIVAMGLPASVFTECQAGSASGSQQSVERVGGDRYEMAPGSGGCTAGYISQTYSFTGQFSPTAKGVVSCVLDITIDGAVQTMTLTGTGLAPPVQIAVSPSAVAFGDTRVATDSTPAPVTVSNLGSSTMTVSSVTTDNGVFEIVTGTTTSHTVASNGTDAFTVACHPNATGPVSGNLVISSNDPTAPTTNVALTCNGINSTLALSQAPLTMNTRLDEPLSQMLTLTNTGTATLTIEGIAITGTDLSITAAPANNTVLAAGTGSADVTVAYAATMENTGGPLGTLTITYDGGQTRVVAINGEALRTSMSITPDGAQDLGAVCVGTPASLAFTAHADDMGTFVVTGITAAAPFFVTAMNPMTAPTAGAPFTVIGNGASTLAFTVGVMATTPGVVSTTITVATDIPPGGIPHTIPIRATAFASGVNATPTQLDLGTRAVGQLTDVGIVMLTNCGSGTVTVLGADIEGVDAADFAIVSPPSSTSLTTGAVSTVGVVAQPHFDGPSTATLVIMTDSGMLSVPLLGNGIDAPAPVTPPNQLSTYYTCSTGGPSAVWPIALAAIGLVGVRRRRGYGRRAQ